MSVLDVVEAETEAGIRAAPPVEAEERYRKRKLGFCSGCRSCGSGCSCFGASSPTCCR